MVFISAAIGGVALLKILGLAGTPCGELISVLGPTCAHGALHPFGCIGRVRERAQRMTIWNRGTTSNGHKNGKYPKPEPLDRRFRAGTIPVQPFSNHSHAPMELTKHEVDEALQRHATRP